MNGNYKFIDLSIGISNDSVCEVRAIPDTEDNP